MPCQSNDQGCVFLWLMVKLNFPDFEHRLLKKDGKIFIFDFIRKKYLVLTPEEWVRQHVVHYLVEHLQYPKSLIKLEGGLSINELARRSDAVVYRSDGTAFMLIECKAPSVKLDQNVFTQTLNYQRKIQSGYILITNGMAFYCAKFFENGDLERLDQIPSYL